VVYLNVGISVKKIYYLLTFLIARIGRLVFALFSKFLFETAFAIAMHHGFIPVLTKIFCYIVLVGIVLRNDHNLTTGLKQDAQEG